MVKTGGGTAGVDAVTYQVAYAPGGDPHELADALTETFTRMPPPRRQAVWVAGVDIPPRLWAIVLAEVDEGTGGVSLVQFGMPPDEPVAWAVGLPVLFTDRCGVDEITLWNRRPDWAA